MEFVLSKISTHQIALHFMFTPHRKHPLKRAATYIILFYTKCSFKKKSDKKIYVKKYQIAHTCFTKFSQDEHAPEQS